MLTLSGKLLRLDIIYSTVKNTRSSSINFYIVCFLAILSLLNSTGSFAQPIAGYAFTASNGSFTYLSGENLSTPVFASGSNNDDGFSNNNPIGFNFYLGDVPTAYTTFNFSTNGFITLGSGNGTTLSGSLSNNHAGLATNNGLTSPIKKPIIATLWDDLFFFNDEEKSQFSYVTTGVAPNRVLTIEWRKAHWDKDAPQEVVSFQIKLFETSNVIMFIYNSLDGEVGVTGGGASVGIAGTGIGVGNFLSVNELSASATVSSTVETYDIKKKPQTSGLTFTFTPREKQTREQEPNNDVLNANTLWLNGSGTGVMETSDIDWWKVQIDADGRLDVTIQNQGNTGRIYLQLYDSAALHFIDSFSINTGATGTLPTDGLGAGVYCIKLSCEQTSQSSYIISDTLIKTGGVNDPEPADIRVVPAFTLNDTVSGHIGYYHNGTRDEIDKFKFVTDHDGNIYVTFTNNSASDTLICSLGDSSAGAISSVNALPGERVSFYALGLQSGTYFVRVDNWLGRGPYNGFGFYSFTTYIDSVTHPNDIEPNDKPKQALPLPINSSTPGHIMFYYNGKWDYADWYKVVLPEDGMFKISLSSDSNRGRMYFKMYDRDAKTLLKTGSVNALKKADFYVDGLASGTYFIEITQRRNMMGTNTYTLWDSLFTYTYVADSLKEKNNYPFKAASIFINKPIQGHVGFYYNNKRDSVDWWKLNYTDASGKLKLYLQLLPALVDNSIRSVQVQFYSDTLAAPVYSGFFNDSTNIVTLSKLKKGLYYIKLNCVDTASWSAYALKVGGNAELNLLANIQNGEPLLEWTATDEAEVKGYAIEKSNDGINFTNIGFVAAKPGSAINYYSFTDNTTTNGKYYYYRLKQVNGNGEYAYAAAVALKPEDFQWYITGDKIPEIHLQLAKQSSVQLQVISSNGSVISIINKGSLLAGNHSISVNLVNKPSGIYTIKLVIDKTVGSKQFFKP